jgi:hypothetical protein
LSFVGVKDFPLLIASIVVVVDNNCLSFNIFVTAYIKDLFVLNVHELVSNKSEDLEPARIGAPNLHVISLTSILDIP